MKTPTFHLRKENLILTDDREMDVSEGKMGSIINKGVTVWQPTVYYHLKHNARVQKNTDTMKGTISEYVW